MFSLHTVVWLLAVPGVIGLALLMLGILGRRVGDAPYCRKCGYNLTGISSERCPECGRPWTLETAVIGQRKRRPRAIVIGLILFVPAAGLVITAQTNWARSIDWYQKLPTWWILFESRSANEPWALRAFKELERRETAGELDADDLTGLLDAALTQFSRRKSVFDPRTDIEDLVAIRLDDAAQRRQLSNEQIERLCDQLIWVSWECRLVVAIGDRIPVEFGEASHACGFGRFEHDCEVEEISMAVNGGEPAIVFRGQEQEQDDWGGPGDLELSEPFGRPLNLAANVAFNGWAPPTLCWRQHKRWLVEADQPGSYEFRLRCRVTVYPDRAGRDAKRGEPLYEAIRTLTARSRVVDTLPSSAFNVVTGEAVKREMEKRLRVERAYWDVCYTDEAVEAIAAGGTYGQLERPCIEVVVDSEGPLPVDIAYAARLEGDGWSADAQRNPFYVDDMVAERHLPGDICPSWRGDQGYSATWWFSFPIEDPDVDHVTLVLAPEPALAKRSIDVTEICGEVLRFERLRVHPSEAEAYGW